MKRLVAALSVLLTASAAAQTYPARPLRMVTQFSAGSGGDAITRVLATHLSEILGQAVVIENRAGAGGVQAAEAAARAAPDGYTFLAATPSVFVIRVAAGSKISIDPTRDLVPMMAMATTPSIIVANAAVPVNSFRELLDYAKRYPNKLSYGTSGVGSAHHMAAEQIRLLSGAEMVHVPYKAGAQALLDLVSGQIPIGFIILGEAVPQVKAGKIKVLATREEKRLREFPDSPTVGEHVPGFEPLPGWTGLFTPAGVPQPIFRRLHGDAVKAVRLPEATQKINENGFEVIANTPEEFAAQIKRQVALVASLAKAANIKLE